MSPALTGYSFSVAPALTTLTALFAVLAGAAPVGITIAIGELVDGLTSAIGQGLDTAAARECYRWVRVVEVGTHDTLSETRGLYAELFRLQARYFV